MTEPIVITELKKLGNPKVAYIKAEAGDLARYILALSSRETGQQNIVGGGYFKADGGLGEMVFVRTGVDRGMWQLNINAHHEFLASTPGCVSGSFTEAPSGHTAAEVGYVPRLGSALHYVLRLRINSLAFARKNKVKTEDQYRFMLAAHNLGDHGALVAYQHGGIDYVDSVTPHGNYSRDTMNRAVIIGDYLPKVK